MTHISVIIPTCNGQRTIGALLDALKTQSLNCGEILVMDSGSDDGTCEIAASAGATVMSVARNDFDHGTTRNLAARRTSGEFIVFLTQDVKPLDWHLIERLIGPMESDAGIAATYGRQLPYPDADTIEAFARSFNYPSESQLKSKSDLPHLGIKTFFFSDCCSAIRRSVFEKLGGFEDGVGTNEDMLFAATAITNGYGIYYAHDAAVYHSHNYTLAALCRRYFAIGAFFARHRWLLKAAPARGEGARMLRCAISHLRSARHSHLIPWLLLQAACKATAMQLGRASVFLSPR
jgi:rhamnosyltransferase